MTAVAFVAGVSGFGFGLLATPFLLMIGYSLPLVVAVNLLLGVMARITVAVRLRSSINVRRVLLLVVGLVPGLCIGTWLLGSLAAKPLKVIAGAAVITGAIGLALSERYPPRASTSSAPLLAGFLGGLLTTTTSLSGVAPALLLARQRSLARQFIADMAAYFIISGLLGVLALRLTNNLSAGVWRTFLYWLPGLLVANFFGTTLGLHLPQRTFRFAGFVVALIAGVLTITNA